MVHSIVRTSPQTVLVLLFVPAYLSISSGNFVRFVCPCTSGNSTRRSSLCLSGTQLVQSFLLSFFTPPFNFRLLTFDFRLIFHLRLPCVRISFASRLHRGRPYPIYLLRLLPGILCRVSVAAFCFRYSAVFFRPLLSTLFN